MDKVFASAQEALAGIVKDGQMIAVGGFGLCGIPEALIAALRDSGVKDLTCISNNAGVDGFGLGQLLNTRQVRKMIASYVGENKEFERQYLSGELELEFTPQGTLAEKLRAGGAGIPAFYTRSGVGTQVAEGGLPMRYDADGTVVKSSQAKPTDTFVLGEGYLSQTPDEPETYVLERSIVTDFSLVHAWKGDRHGNLVFRKATRQFGPPAAMAGRVCIAQVEELVEPGEIDPDDVHLPGVFVHRIVEVGTDIEKRIEKRTVRASGEEQA